MLLSWNPNLGFLGPYPSFFAHNNPNQRTLLQGLGLVRNLNQILIHFRSLVSDTELQSKAISGFIQYKLTYG